MKYFICFFVLFAFILTCFLWQRQKHRIQSLFIKKILYQKYNEETDTFFALFADEIFEMTALAVLSAPLKAKHRLFKSLKQADEKPLFYYLKQNEAQLFAILNTLLTKKHYTPKKAPVSSSKFSKLAAMLGFESQLEYHLPESTFAKPHLFFASKRLRRLTKMFEARRLFLKTDLKRSSEILIKLAKIYVKENDALKTAYVYFMLGQIYSLSKAFDTAQIIFEKALQIYKKTHHLYGEHLVLTAIGLNFMCQEHFENAHTYFQKVKRFSEKSKNLAFQARILNFQSCCHLNGNDFKKAHKTADTALKLHQKNGNQYGMAFSLEIKAAASSAACRHAEAITHAKSALKHYRLLKNQPAEQKMLFLLTKIYYNAGQQENAKKMFATYLKYKNLHHLSSFEDEKNLKEILIR